MDGDSLFGFMADDLLSDAGTLSSTTHHTDPHTAALLAKGSWYYRPRQACGYAGLENQ